MATVANGAHSHAQMKTATAGEPLVRKTRYVSRRLHSDLRYHLESVIAIVPSPACSRARLCKPQTVRSPGVPGTCAIEGKQVLALLSVAYGLCSLKSREPAHCALMLAAGAWWKRKACALLLPRGTTVSQRHLLRTGDIASCGCMRKSHRVRQGELRGIWVKGELYLTCARLAYM